MHFMYVLLKRRALKMLYIRDFYNASFLSVIFKETVINAPHCQTVLEGNSFVYLIRNYSALFLTGII
jgi:hypothetical protein